MFIRLNFQEKTDESGNDNNTTLVSKCITLSGDPIIVTELPVDVEPNKRVGQEDNTEQFSYFIDCEKADQACIETAIALFKSEYKEKTDKRFVANTLPEIIPAVILMKNAFQRTYHPGASTTNDEKTTNTKPVRGYASYLPDRSTFSNLAQYATGRNLLFAAGAAVTVTAVGAAILTLGKKSE